MFDKIRSMLKPKALPVPEKPKKFIDNPRTAMFDDYLEGTDAYKDRWHVGGGTPPSKTLVFQDKLYHYYASVYTGESAELSKEHTLTYDLNTGDYLSMQNNDYIDSLRRYVTKENEKTIGSIRENAVKNVLAHTKIADLSKAIFDSTPVDDRTQAVNRLLRGNGDAKGVNVSIPMGLGKDNLGGGVITGAAGGSSGGGYITGVSVQHEIPYHEAKKKVMNHENWREVGEYLGKYPLNFNMSRVEVAVGAPNMTSIVQLKVKPLETTLNKDIVVTLDLVIQNDMANMTRLPVWLVHAKKVTVSANPDDLSDRQLTISNPQRFSMDCPLTIVDHVMKLLELPVLKETKNQGFAPEWKEVETSEYIPVDEPLLVYYGAEESLGLPAYMTEATLCGITGEWKSQTQETLRKITHWAMQPVGPLGPQINKTQQLL